MHEGHAKPDLEPAATMTKTQRLTIERLFASPSLSGPVPMGVKYAPDGQRVTFLKARGDEGDRYDLWQFDTTSGEQSLLVDSRLLEPDEAELSEAEKAMRERKRIAGRKGIVSYDWGTGDTILVPLGGNLHLVRLGADGPTTRQLTDTDAFEYDARVSPAGGHVSFIRDGALYAINLSDDQETRLSPQAEPDKAISYGVAEFVAQEEMSRYTGYWWSPDERYVAYTRVDESPVDIIPRFDIAAEAVTVIEQRYPRAGRANAIVDLFVHDMATGETTQIDWRRDDWGPATDQYLARVNWLEDGTLTVQRVNRNQTQLDLVCFAPGAREGVIGFTETQDKWVNLSDDFVPVGEATVLLTSEESGFRAIWRRDLNAPQAAGTLIAGGDWAIDAIKAHDVDRGAVYFTGYRDTPLERHLYEIAATGGGEPRRITEPGQSWTVTMAPDAASFVATSSSPSQPPRTGLYRTDGTLIAWIEENRLDPDHPYAPFLASHTVPTYGTLVAEDGQALHYSIQLPPDFDATCTYPAIVEVYGGPHAQTVHRDWRGLSDQFLAHQDYIVFRLDNRGSANRGKQFEDAIYRQTGGPEVRDQLVGVAWLKAQGFVDADRVAIQGWSYGGYMTLMTLLQAAPGTFAAAVAGAPVTDWSLYDTFYTERYMDTPQDNPAGYDASSVFHHLERWTGDLSPLLLVHGMADDNVTFDNTTRLMAVLQERGLGFDLMTYPGQRHGIRGEALQAHLMKTRLAFLNRHLKA